MRFSNSSWISNWITLLVICTVIRTAPPFTIMLFEPVVRPQEHFIESDKFNRSSIRNRLILGPTFVASLWLWDISGIQITRSSARSARIRFADPYEALSLIPSVFSTRTYNRKIPWLRCACSPFIAPAVFPRRKPRNKLLRINAQAYDRKARSTRDKRKQHSTVV